MLALLFLFLCAGLPSLQMFSMLLLLLFPPFLLHFAAFEIQFCAAAAAAAAVATADTRIKSAAAKQLRGKQQR